MINKLCTAKAPKIEKPKVSPLPTEAPEAPPDPVEIQKDSAEKTRKKRNPLRIDLASSNGSRSSGVNL